jgi:hypothetical protein
MNAPGPVSNSAPTSMVRAFGPYYWVAIASAVMAIWSGRTGWGHEDEPDRGAFHYVFAGSDEVVGSGLKSSRRPSAARDKQAASIRTDTPRGHSAPARESSGEPRIRTATIGLNSGPPRRVPKTRIARVRNVQRDGARVHFLQDAWEEKWTDPYEATEEQANSDAYLDLDLYERLQTRILDSKQVPLSGSSTPVEQLWDDHFPGESASSDWTFRWLPDGLVYSPPMADPKASRLGIRVFHERDDGWLYDAALGATTGILRFGSADPQSPDGFQLDLEGSAQLRLDIPEELDVRSADFRVGVPLSYGVGRWRSRVGYYHISSHLGDEFLLKNPGFRRLNFVRDVLYVNQSVYPMENWRLYADVGWAFYSDIANEWEFQFGTEWIARHAWFGAYPFWAVNGKVREELDYGGDFNAQFGWLWKADNGRRLRLGFHYFNGHSNQWSFYRQHEEQLGFGLWLDR